MIPVIAIIGRPNVGKSTLFNQLTGTRQALVVDLPGVTRDRQFGEGEYEGQKFIVIDTGGLETDKRADVLWKHVASQAHQAMLEADVVLFMLDAQTGIIPADQTILTTLRQLKKPVLVIVNKMDGQDPKSVLPDFYQLGLGHPLGISAAHQRGMQPLLKTIFERLAELPNFAKGALEAESDKAQSESETSEGDGADAKDEASGSSSRTAERPPRGVKLAIVGKPNVGKSTLVNRLLGEERVIAFDAPGTTRDSIYIPFTRQGKPYVLIDTAGVRKRARIDQALEKFSVVKTLQAIEDSDVAVLMINADEGLTDQDLSLLHFILEAGRPLVIALNQWDKLTTEKKTVVKTMLAERLAFAKFAQIHPMSALKGQGLVGLWRWIDKAYEASIKTFSTATLTRLLQKATTEHQPPLVQGRRIKLRYAHSGGQRPPLIVIHGNQTEALPEAYRRYLNNFFHHALRLEGTPLTLIFKTGDNPYAGRRNTLTPRQEQKRKRLMDWVKKRKKR